MTQPKMFYTFQNAFVHMIKSIHDEPQHIVKARKDQMMYEVLGAAYTIADPTTYKFEDESLGRIPYDYANDFYNWMIAGCGDEATEEFKKKYPHVEGFLAKPKSETLPDNFNVFYGPRIVRQLPKIIKEVQNGNSRRAVINILNEDDLELLDKPEDSNLEYPCCDSFVLMPRNGKLHGHLHMRSNNMGNVAKLDMYLWGRFLCEFAKEQGFEVGTFTSTIVSAHIFSSDFEYFKSKNII